MQENVKTENVKAFIQKTLGCDCDESVFKHIENERHAEARGIKLRNRINVGGRLLVYVVDAEGPSFVRSHLTDLLEAGRKERDDRSFNRFRLVLVAASDSGVQLEVNRAIEHLKAVELSKAVDEKVHVHVLEKSDVAAL